MKRIILFVLTNVLVVAVLGIVVLLADLWLPASRRRARRRNRRSPAPDRWPRRRGQRACRGHFRKRGAPVCHARRSRRHADERAPDGSRQRAGHAGVHVTRATARPRDRRPRQARRRDPRPDQPLEIHPRQRKAGRAHRARPALGQPTSTHGSQTGSPSHRMRWKKRRSG